MDMKDIVRFYRHNVRLKPFVYVVVGDSRRIDMKELAGYGEVIRLRKKDIYK